MKCRRQYTFGILFILTFLLAFGAVTVGAQPVHEAKVSFDPAVAAKSVDKNEIQPKGPAPAASTNTAVTRVGVQTANPISLTLEDAIRRALTNNNGIEISRDDVRIQETVIRSLLGTYDPVFNVTPTYTRNSTTGNAATNDFVVNSNMQHLLRAGGGDYQVFFNNTRTENAFSQAQVSSGSLGTGGSSAIYSSSWGVRYRQPLFRNFGIDTTRRNIRIARRILQQTDADFRRQTIDTISQVQRTYWD
ncbi:MAG: TolC family protein, partial [Acidobacteria bacterium]|nr:TolC family protein [Acidobacteriota bacterium]